MDKEGSEAPFLKITSPFGSAEKRCRILPALGVWGVPHFIKPPSLEGALMKKS